MTALAQERGAIGIGVFEGVVVEDFAVFFLGADLATAHAMSLNRVGVLHPIGDVQVVDVLLGDVIAAQPVEVVPIAHLELELGLPFLARVNPNATVVPVGTDQVDVAESAIVQALHGLQVARLVMTLQADADLQVLFLGFLGCGENAADSGTIDGHGFLHEHVFTLADSLLEMLRAKSRGRCQNDHVGQRDGLLVTIETDELPVSRHVYLSALGGLQAVEGTGESVLEGVGHGHELDARDIEGLVGCAGTTAAATDEGDLDLVAGGTERQALDGQAADHGSAEGGAGGGEETAPG